MFLQKNSLTERDFDCSSSQLTSLEGAPREVRGNFDCSENQLTSLEGAPQEVGGNFYCDRNQLTSLEGAPREVKRDFYCDRNQLTSLEGAPQEVGGYFDCRGNQLTSLKGVHKFQRSASDEISMDDFAALSKRLNKFFKGNIKIVDADTFEKESEKFTGEK